MTIKECNLSEYGIWLRNILMKEVGIQRIKQLLNCNDHVLDEQDLQLNNALCEYAVFNECIKTPFFDILCSTLSNRPEKLFGLLLKNKEYLSALRYEEAFVFLSEMDLYKTRAILDVYASNNNKISSIVYNGVLDAIKEDDYETFKSVLESVDCQDMMTALWKMQYYIKGIEDSSSKVSNRYSVFHSFFNIYDRYDEKSIIGELKTYITEIDRKRRLRRNPLGQLKDEETQQLTSITTIADGSYYGKWIELYHTLLHNQPKLSHYFSDIDKDKARILHDYSRIPYLIMREVITGQTQQIKTRIINNKIDLVDDRLFIYNDDYHDVDIIGKGILLYTYIMLRMFDEVQEILNDEERCILEWILGCSKYTDIVKGNIAKIDLVKEEVDETDATNDEYAEYIKEWKKANYKESTFSITAKIDDEEYELLRIELIKQRFIWEGTTVETLKHVLGGLPKYSDFKPIIWVAPRDFDKENNQFNHASIINLLLLLGVDIGHDNKKDLKRLNYCFIRKNSSKKYERFKSNFFSRKKNEKQAEAQKVTTSKHDDRLREIINKCLGKKYPVYKTLCNKR